MKNCKTVTISRNEIDDKSIIKPSSFQSSKPLLSKRAKFYSKMFLHHVTAGNVKTLFFSKSARNFRAVRKKHWNIFSITKFTTDSSIEASSLQSRPETWCTILLPRYFIEFRTLSGNEYYYDFLNFRHSKFNEMTKEKTDFRTSL